MPTDGDAIGNFKGLIPHNWETRKKAGMLPAAALVPAYNASWR
jgi:hypothetical protein